MGVLRIQSSFARGEVSPDFYLRDDTDMWAHGAKEMTNVLTKPQGGLERRPASQYFATLAGKAKLARFEFNVDQVYVVAFSDLKAEVFDAGALGVVVTTPYTMAQLFDISFPVRWAQQGDTMILVHEAHAPRKLVRNVGGSGSLAAAPFATVNTSNVVTVTHANHGLVTGHTVVFAGAATVNNILAADINVVTGHVITVLDKDSYTWVAGTNANATGSGGGASVTWTAADYWTLTTITLTNIPTFNFEDALTPSTTDEIQDLTFTGVWAAGDTYRLQIGERKTKILEYSTSVTEQIDTIRDGLMSLPELSEAGDDDLEIVNTSGGGTDPDGPYRITFTGELGNTDWADIVPTIRNSPGGGLISVATITEGASGQEPVWSATRGWPRSVMFHEQRCFFGGTPHLPASIWGSKTEEPFDFFVGTGLDDEAIEAAMTADRFDAVVQLASLRNFVTLTSGGEYYSPEAPITPRNVAFRRDTARGVSPIPVVVLDGSVIFVQRDRSSIRQMVFTDVENAYVADDLTILSRHMLVSPSDMTVQQGTLGDYVYVVNSDGTMLVLNTNRSQGVAAWTRYTTRDGDKFISVTALPDSLLVPVPKVWVCVERDIDGSTVYYLERLDAGRLLDCSKTVTGSDLTTWGGLDHLEGEEVTIILDNGANILTGTVVGGEVTTSIAGDHAEIGFNSAIPVVETLPVTVDSQQGRLALRKKRVLRATVDVVESNDVRVGYPGEEVLVDPPHFGFDAPPANTGPFEARILGWRDQPTVRVTQERPFPFAIRGIELEVEIHA